jgi:HAD superfamily hydrolase (TIGR01549 family)
VTAIRAALFDIDGTLYHQLPVRLCMAAEMALHFAATGAPLAFRRQAATLLAFRKVREELRTVGHAPLALADLQFEETAIRTNVAPDEVRRLVDEWMLNRPNKYLWHARRRNVVSLVAGLAGTGVRLGAFSDYPAERKLEALGLRGLFGLTLCATDPGINAFKPHPRGLLRACELWGLSPAEVVYVGDRADVDAAAAEAAGMRCYLVNVSTGARSARTSDTTEKKDTHHGSRGLSELRRDCRAAA